MKKTSWRSLVLGVLLAALVMGLAVPALAVTGQKQMNVDYIDIKLTVDGVPAPVGTPFISEGTTYLPVRAIGEALYKEVRWDGPTHTIYIDDPTEETTETKSNTVTVDKSKKTIDVDYLDIKLVVDGKEVTPKDANGKVVEPFAYNGTTYLPVRAVGEALGKTVRWDGETKTVHLGELPQATYLVDACKVDKYNEKNGYIYRAADHKSFTMIDGKRYSQGFNAYNDSVFELGGKYESITFDVGLEPLSSPEKSMKVYLDVELAQTIKVSRDSGVQRVTVPLNYAETICFSGSPYVANAVLSGEREAPVKPVPPADATYLVDVCNGRYIGYKAAKNQYFEDTFGNKYTNGIVVYDGSQVPLNGAYKTLKATAIYDGTGIWGPVARCTFYVDGEVVGELSLCKDEPPKTIEIPLNYGMRLEVKEPKKNDYVRIFLADAILE